MARLVRTAVLAVIALLLVLLVVGLLARQTGPAEKVTLLALAALLVRCAWAVRRRRA
jgi:positive regulator of sigma E activity